MRFWLKQYIFLLPIILLGVDFLALWMPIDFVFMGNLAGYSLITNILFIYVFTLGDYCSFTRISPIGMMMLNVVNITGLYFPDKIYHFWYTFTVLCVILSLTLILEISKRIKR